MPESGPARYPRPMHTLDSIDPATGAVVGSVPSTPVAAVAEAVARARAAQPGWADLGLDERLARLAAAGPLFSAQQQALGELATREMGKPLREAVGEAGAVAGGFERKLAEIRAALEPETRESSRVHTQVVRDPLGVAACISPWNFPILMPHQQVVPALAAGNTVVMKPSEETPLVGQAYAEILQQVLPPDVLQVIHGDEVQGKALVAADVDLVVFTGSREAGKHILAAASGSLKRVILELGGKDPLVVLDDADLDAAARFAARNSFRNAGQVCVSTERIYVDDTVHDAFVDRLIHHAAAMPVGSGLDDATRIGPMVNGRQKAHVQAQVRVALDDGAQVAWRGEELGGNFLAPVVLTEVRHDMLIARDETFGPVACVIRTRDPDEAIRQANDTRFGLGAAVFGSDDRAWAVARRLSAGMVGVNQGLASAGGTPWVGARESGYGFHSGPEGHRQFAQVRVISRPL